MAMEPEMEAGFREETISTLLSSLFLIKSQIMHGRRLLNDEQ